VADPNRRVFRQTCKGPFGVFRLFTVIAPIQGFGRSTSGLYKPEPGDETKQSRQEGC
jgi:hypothetical protein